jgi:hypothetical protein
MGILPPHPSQWRSSAFPIEMKEFNRLDILTLARLTRAINFIKGKMDRGELSEGITWKELYQVLNGRKGREVWIDLLFLLLDKKSFFTLRKDSRREASILKEKSSKRVLDHFFEKAWGRPIFGSRKI